MTRTLLPVRPGLIDGCRTSLSVIVIVIVINLFFGSTIAKIPDLCFVSKWNLEASTMMPKKSELIFETASFPDTPMANPGIGLRTAAVGRARSCRRRISQFLVKDWARRKLSGAGCTQHRRGRMLKVSV